MSVFRFLRPNATKSSQFCRVAQILLAGWLFANACAAFAAEGVVSSANFQAVISPGSIATVFGSNLANGIISAKLDDQCPEENYVSAPAPKFAPEKPVEEVTPVNEAKAYKALKAS